MGWRDGGFSVLGLKPNTPRKRQQLQGVQSLFRSFAAQLERQLRESHSQKDFFFAKLHQFKAAAGDLKLHTNFSIL